MPKKVLIIILALLVIIFGTWAVINQRHEPTESSSSSNQPSKQKSSSTQTTSEGFDKTKDSIADPSSTWIVVNKKRPLNPLTYTPADLVSIGSGQLMRSEAASAFTHMLASAKTVGYSLVAESGYRSYQTQVSVYNSEVKSFGQAKADTESARPGHSEHQTGFAVDIGTNGCFEDCFGKTAAAPWLVANAYKYGFILRYPNDKSDITGYRNEPWHFRYVGIELSSELHKEGVETLEEFFGLPAAPNY